ncbi:hypothetical protein BRADI_1g10765v3 [Brachypodium distachyon]|uniref:Uncharacterized protein n=1 Tax=Brachypodium distachyon TaxID=15368 RepID=A0A2K2DIY1_BRADI|nr:hypothetical protein BRADI_1g10765v3 [Brachypodium distachyon]
MASCNLREMQLDSQFPFICVHRKLIVQAQGRTYNLPGCSTQRIQQLPLPSPGSKGNYKCNHSGYHLFIFSQCHRVSDFCLKTTHRTLIRST